MPHPHDSPPPRAETGVSNDAGNQGAQGTFNGPVAITNTVAMPAAVGADALAPARRAELLALLAGRYAVWSAGNLAHAVRLQLGLHTRPAAIAPPWRRLHLRGPRLPAQPVPPDTPVQALFDQHQRRVLVLGAPGAGKTTLLVELAQALTARAQADPTQPLPVVLNLASWQSGQSIRDWLVGVLPDVLGASEAFAAQLARGQELLLLLDGLDELAEERRPGCVAAINAYLESADLAPPLVVGCRSAEYAALGARLALDSAIELEPLDLPAVERALADVPAAHGVLLALQTDELLRELARTPLIVNVLLLAYADQDLPVVQASTPEELRATLWTAYLRRMLAQRPLPAPWTPAQALGCLRWLARLLRDQNQTNFLLDDLQPAALPSAQLLRRYRWLVGLIFGCSLGMLIGLFVWLLVGPCFGLPVGFAFGLFVGWGIAKRPIKRQEHLIWSWLRFWSCKSTALRWGLVGGIGGGLFFGIAFGLNLGIVAGLNRGLSIGLRNFLSVGLMIWLDEGWQLQELNGRVWPGEGIRASMRTGCVRGLLCGVLVGLVNVVVIGRISGVVIGLIGGVVVGLMAGLTMGLFNGLDIVVQHHMLCRVLDCVGLLPLDAVPFLDALRDRLLLERDGALYRFRHILLRDFCADLTDAQIAALAREVQDEI